MTENLKPTLENGLNGEKPVARHYIRTLVNDYINYSNSSKTLNLLFTSGLPKDARIKPPLIQKEQGLKQDLRDVLYTILETYDFWGEVIRKSSQEELRRTPYKPFTSNQGLPHLGLINLKNSLNGINNPTIRFKKNEDGSIVVKGVEAKDFGARGYPPDFYMAYEYLMISTDGRIKLSAKYFPGKDENGPEREYFKDHPTYPNSLPILRSLTEIALNGAKLQEKDEVYKIVEVLNSGIMQKKTVKKLPIFT